MEENKGTIDDIFGRSSRIMDHHLKSFSLESTVYKRLDDLRSNAIPAESEESVTLTPKQLQLVNEALVDACGHFADAYVDYAVAYGNLMLANAEFDILDKAKFGISTQSPVDVLQQSAQVSSPEQLEVTSKNYSGGMRLYVRALRRYARTILKNAYKVMQNKDK